MGRLQRHLLAGFAMLLGSATVFLFLILMNSYTTPPTAREKQTPTAFEVRKPPKRKRLRPRPKPKPKKSTQTKAPAAPIPDLAGGLASVTLEMPGFDTANLGAGAEDLLGASQKDMVMDERSVDDPPKAVARVAPSEYPPAARKNGITGFVKMNLLIGVSGEVERVKVLEAEPAGVFDEVAVGTIRQWKFQPAVYQAEHVRVWATQTIRFELE